MQVYLQPDYWSSAHRPIRYDIGFDRNFGVVVNNGSGKARIVFGADARTIVRTGMKIYIKDGTYKGLHTVTSNVSYNAIFDTNTNFTINDFFADAHVLYVPNFEIWKGHDSADPYPTQLPRSRIAVFTPEYIFDSDYDEYVVKIDIHGYLKQVFRNNIQPPVLDGIDFNMFNKFQVVIVWPQSDLAFGAFRDYLDKRNIANSSIKSSVLNSVYRGTGTYLSDEGNPPYLFTCGKSIFSLLEEEFIKNETFSPDIPLNCDFVSEDFTSEYLVC